MIQRAPISLLAALLLLTTTIGCGSDAPTTPAPPTTARNGTMTAVIDGTSWTATSIVPSITGNITAIGANEGTRTLAFAWVDAGTGTYQTPSSIGFNANLTVGGGVWTANATAGTGTLVVTSRTSTRIAGTFSFTMQAASGNATGTKTVTQGVFDITLP